MQQKNLNDHLAPPRMLLRTPKGCEHPWLGTPGLHNIKSQLFILVFSYCGVKYIFHEEAIIDYSYNQGRLVAKINGGLLQKITL